MDLYRSSVGVWVGGEGVEIWLAMSPKPSKKKPKSDEEEDVGIPHFVKKTEDLLGIAIGKLIPWDTHNV